tara:strand:+ start:18659 stop:20089 length:1431 start_codon:yes stop_codon:yes gene_type:complete
LKYTKRKISTICCIGAGYVGGPTMAVLADKCEDIKVYVVDKNKERINAWNSHDLNNLPVYEPKLSAVISRARDRNLFFSENVRKYIGLADMIFLSVNTPTKVKGIGSGQASDLKWIEACARDVAKWAKGHTIIVEKSTIPVRTAETIKIILESDQADKNKKTFSVLSNPEFLAEGSAINDLENPDRVLIGGENEDSINSLCEIYERWVDKGRIIKTNLWSSELSKLIANAFLAQRVSSINSISALCEKTGADIIQVSDAIGSDTRIGSRFLEAGPGFGGSCFKKDILNLVYLCNHFGLPEVANYWNSVISINNWQQKRISQTIVNKLFGTLTDKKIVILGFSFKADTNDTRESPAIYIAKDLLEEGANLVIHDPKVDQKQIEFELGIGMSCTSIEKNIVLSEKKRQNNWQYANSIENAIENADAVVIITNWIEYKNLNWKNLYKKMRKPAWLFDTRSLININDIKNIGINIWQIGT